MGSFFITIILILGIIIIRARENFVDARYKRYYANLDALRTSWMKKFVDYSKTCSVMDYVDNPNNQAVVWAKVESVFAELESWDYFPKQKDIAYDILLAEKGKVVSSHAIYPGYIHGVDTQKQKRMNEEYVLWLRDKIQEVSGHNITLKKQYRFKGGPSYDFVWKNSWADIPVIRY